MTTATETTRDEFDGECCASCGEDCQPDEGYTYEFASTALAAAAGVDEGAILCDTCARQAVEGAAGAVEEALENVNDALEETGADLEAPLTALREAVETLKGLEEWGGLGGLPRRIQRAVLEVLR